VLRPLLAPAVVLLTLTSAYGQETTPRNANYRIDVRLDARGRTLTGRETLEWTNITRADARELQFHLYYNAWRNDDSTYMKEAQRSGWFEESSLQPDEHAAIDISDFKVAGLAPAPLQLTSAIRFIAPDDGNTEDRTVIAVSLPVPVRPAQTISIDISWTSRIPYTVDRTGVVGNNFFFGQWFPKIGVFQDDGTWNCHQFHRATEFFADYGVYDVRMTVPRGWPLAATGKEQERRDGPDGTTTYRYYQEDVHDFAWTTSPDYLELHQRFEYPGLPPVDMRLMLQPEHRSQAQWHFDSASITLRYYGEWFGPYPYDHVTIVDPAWQSAAGGMEYPTLFTVGSEWLRSKYDSYAPDTVVHEMGHQWWYGLVGSNEFEDAWMDEGINQYANARADAEGGFSKYRLVHRFFGRMVPWAIRDIPWDRVVFGDYVSDYRRRATIDIPSMPSYRYWPGSPGAITYAKTAVWLQTLERALGWPVMQRILSTYFSRWEFRHPKPADFFAVVNEQSGRDLGPFIDQVYRGSATFDYAVESLKSTRLNEGTFRADVVVRRYGDGIFPVTVLVSFADGAQTRLPWNGGDRWTLLSTEHRAEPVSAQVDPDQILLLDVNFTNNSYAIKPDGPRAATKWAASWMVWLEDQLLTWAFFL
jgi:hypothetical protein